MTPESQFPFLLLEGTEASGRAFVLHLEFPRFVLEFGAGDRGDLLSADPASADVLGALCAEAHSFFVREVKSFDAYEIVRPEN